VKYKIVGRIYGYRGATTRVGRATRLSAAFVCLPENVARRCSLQSSPSSPGARPQFVKGPGFSFQDVKSYPDPLSLVDPSALIKLTLTWTWTTPVNNRLIFRWLLRHVLLR